jgi:mannose/cellobiose epimerase-like protein (N-acyl-D-glucosamine 2-epimerase family)
MPLLAPFVGRERDVAFANAQRQVEYALRSGRADGKAGLVEKLAPARERLRTWWVQTEVIQALVLLEVNGIGRSFRPEIEEFTSLVEAEMLDERYGGWHQLPRSDWSFVDKIRARRLPKAHRWKDSSHETDMYLSAIRMLRGLRAAAPIHD